MNNRISGLIDPPTEYVNMSDLESKLGLSLNQLGYKSTKSMQVKITVSEMPVEGGVDSNMSNINPRVDLAKFIEDNASAEEKEQCFKEILEASVEGIRTNNESLLRQVLLDWEYTLSWKANTKHLKHLHKQMESSNSNSDGSIDWKDFMSNL